MNAGSLFGLLMAAGVGYFVYQDATSRGWESGSAILIAIGVFALLIIFLPIYLVIKNNPGRSKITIAAYRAISRQSSQGIQNIVLDANEIAREVGIAKVAFVRQMLFRCKTNGEIPSEVTIL
jgi:ABC-type proline/glycine betaine transport system permease subunit